MTTSTSPETPQTPPSTVTAAPIATADTRLDSQIPADRQAAIHSRITLISTLRETIKSEADPEKLKTLKKELQTLEHEQMRDQTFLYAMSPNITAEDNDDKANLDRIQKEQKGKSADSISAADLIRLERAQHGILSRMYLFTHGKDADGNDIDMPIRESDIRTGMDMSVDFGKNGNADARVGAGHMLPPSVNTIKVIDSEGHVRIGQRMTAGAEVGYYDAEGRYLDIHTGYTIHIPTDEELQTPEYQAIKIKQSLTTDPAEIERRRQAERTSNLAFASQIENSDKMSEGAELMGKILSQATGATFAEKVRNAISIVDDIEKSTSAPTGSPETVISALTPIASGYDARLLTSVHTNLNNLLRNAERINGSFDFAAYKRSIAYIESRGNYYCRNDNIGRRQGIDASRWAYGKYQFTREEIGRYAHIQLGNPPDETQVQNFLRNPNLQEEAMDAKIVQNISEVMSGKGIYHPATMDLTSANPQHHLSYYLALVHIGGPGALKHETHDWMGTSTDSYAHRIEMSAQ